MTLNDTNNNNTQYAVLPTFGLSTRDAILISAFSLIFVVGVVGNCLVCYVFGSRKSRRRTTTEWLILYLGIVDLLASLFHPPLQIYWAVTKHRVWHFGLIGCKIIPSIGPIMTSASAGILCLIAIDRFVAIVIPFKGQLTVPTITKAAIATILISALMYANYIHNLEILEIDEFFKICMVRNISAPSHMIPNLAFILLRLLLFSTVFVITNVVIFISLKKQTNKLTLEKIRIQRHRENKRTMRVLYTMGIVFVVLIYPRELFQLYLNFSWITGTDGIPITSDMIAINSWLFVMHASNSCANVFIYAHMHHIYRTHLIKFISCFRKQFNDSKESTEEAHDTYPEERRPRNNSLSWQMILPRTEDGAFTSVVDPLFHYIQNNEQPER